MKFKLKYIIVIVLVLFFIILLYNIYTSKKIKQNIKPSSQFKKDIPLKPTSQFKKDIPSKPTSQFKKQTDIPFTQSEQNQKRKEMEEDIRKQREKNMKEADELRRQKEREEELQKKGERKQREQQNTDNLREQREAAEQRIREAAEKREEAQRKREAEYEERMRQREEERREREAELAERIRQANEENEERMRRLEEEERIRREEERIRREQAEQLVRREQEWNNEFIVIQEQLNNWGEINNVMQNQDEINREKVQEIRRLMDEEQARGMNYLLHMMHFIINRWYRNKEEEIRNRIRLEAERVREEAELRKNIPIRLSVMYSDEIIQNVLSGIFMYPNGQRILNDNEIKNNIRNLIPLLNNMIIDVTRYVRNDNTLNRFINEIQTEKILKDVLDLTLFYYPGDFVNPKYFIKYVIDLIPQHKIRKFLYNVEGEDDLRLLQQNQDVHSNDNTKFNECIIKALREYKRDPYPYTIQQILEKAVEIERITRQFAEESARFERLQPGTPEYENRVNELTLDQTSLLFCTGDNQRRQELIAEWGFGDRFMRGFANELENDQKIFICELAVRVFDIIQEIENPEEKQSLIGNLISTIKNEIVGAGGVCSTGWANRLTHVLDILSNQSKALLGFNNCYKDGESYFVQKYLRKGGIPPGEFSFQNFYDGLVQILYNDIDDFDERYYAGTKESYQRYEQDILYGYLVEAFIEAFKVYFYTFLYGKNENGEIVKAEFNPLDFVDINNPLLLKFKKEFMNAFRQYRMREFNKLAPGVCDFNQLESQLVLNKFEQFDAYQYNKVLNKIANPNLNVEENIEDVLNLIQNARQIQPFRYFFRRR